MISREEALKLIRKYIKTENTVKHMIALEVIMKELAKRFEPDKQEEWGLAGLLHDLDYEIVDQQTYEGHGLKTTELLKQEGVELPETVVRGILAHNADNLGDDYMPKSKLEWSMFIADSLTGLIVATALVRPSKKLEEVELKSLKKKFKQPSFAAGTRREQIALCEEKLGIPLDEFMQLSLNAMKGSARELGL